MFKQILGIVLGLLLFTAGSSWAANDLSGGTWVLDTANTGTNVTDQAVRINWIVWTNIGTDGDDLILQDGDGKNIIKLKGKAGIDMYLPLGDYVRGFRLHTLDSGEVQVRTR